MIGGIDKVFRVKDAAVAMDMACRLIQEFWKDAVFQNPDSDTSARYDKIPFGEWKELFAWRSASDYVLYNTDYRHMLHLLTGDNELTIVHEPTDTHRQMIAAIAAALRRNGLALSGETNEVQAA